MLSKLLLVVIIFIHIFILTKLIYFPYPELFIYPYLTNHGLKPYSQILDQHFPGLMFLPINFDNLGMNNEISARAWSIGILILTHLLLFYISYKILKKAKQALLVNFLYLIWQPFFEGWVLWIDSFLPLILLPAFYALYKKKLFICGLLLGIGIVFKQTLIPLSLLVLMYVIWENGKLQSASRFLLGLIGPIGLMLFYLINIGVFKDFFYWTIVFNITTYAKSGTSIPSTLGYVSRVLLVYGASIPAWFGKDKRLLKTLFIFLAGSLAGIFDRADFVHFQPSLPFAILATIYGLERIGKLGRVKIVTAVYILITAWWLIVFYKGHIGQKIFFFDENTKMISEKIKKNTKPYDKIFIFGAVPTLYQMSKTLPSGDIFVFQFPWYLKIAGDRVLSGIEKDRPEIVVSDRSVKIENQQLTEYAKEIDQYIQRNYMVIEQVGTASIMRLKEQ